MALLSSVQMYVYPAPSPSPLLWGNFGKKKFLFDETNFKWIPSERCFPPPHVLAGEGDDVGLAWRVADVGV